MRRKPLRPFPFNTEDPELPRGPYLVSAIFFDRETETASLRTEVLNARAAIRADPIDVGCPSERAFRKLCADNKFPEPVRRFAPHLGRHVLVAAYGMPISPERAGKSFEGVSLDVASERVQPVIVSFDRLGRPKWVSFMGIVGEAELSGPLAFAAQAHECGLKGEPALYALPNSPPVLAVLKDAPFDYAAAVSGHAAARA